jgi:Lipase (class 3)
MDTTSKPYQYLKSALEYTLPKGEGAGKPSILGMATTAFYLIDRPVIPFKDSLNDTTITQKFEHANLPEWLKHNLVNALLYTELVYFAGGAMDAEKYQRLNKLSLAQLDIVYSYYKTASAAERAAPAHEIYLNRAKRQVILAIRGTFSAQDFSMASCFVPVPVTSDPEGMLGPEAARRSYASMPDWRDPFQHPNASVQKGTLAYVNAMIGDLGLSSDPSSNYGLFWSWEGATNDNENHENSRSGKKWRKEKRSIEAIRGYTPLIKHLKGMLHNHPGFSLVIVGHSLGGMVAGLLTLRLRRDPTVLFPFLAEHASASYLHSKNPDHFVLDACPGGIPIRCITVAAPAIVSSSLGYLSLSPSAVARHLSGQPNVSFGLAPQYLNSISNQELNAAIVRSTNDEMYQDHASQPEPDDIVTAIVNIDDALAQLNDGSSARWIHVLADRRFQHVAWEYMKTYRWAVYGEVAIAKHRIIIRRRFFKILYAVFFVSILRRAIFKKKINSLKKHDWGKKIRSMFALKQQQQQQQLPQSQSFLRTSQDAKKNRASEHKKRNTVRESEKIGRESPGSFLSHRVLSTPSGAVKGEAMEKGEVEEELDIPMISKLFEEGQKEGNILLGLTRGVTRDHLNGTVSFRDDLNLPFPSSTEESQTNRQSQSLADLSKRLSTFKEQNDSAVELTNIFSVVRAASIDLTPESADRKSLAKGGVGFTRLVSIDEEESSPRSLSSTVSVDDVESVRSIKTGDDGDASASVVKDVHSSASSPVSSSIQSPENAPRTLHQIDENTGTSGGFLSSLLCCSSSSSSSAIAPGTVPGGIPTSDNFSVQNPMLKPSSDSSSPTSSSSTPSPPAVGFASLNIITKRFIWDPLHLFASDDSVIKAEEREAQFSETSSDHLSTTPNSDASNSDLINLDNHPLITTPIERSLYNAGRVLILRPVAKRERILNTVIMMQPSPGVPGTTVHGGSPAMPSPSSIPSPNNPSATTTTSTNVTPLTIPSSEPPTVSTANAATSAAADTGPSLTPEGQGVSATTTTQPAALPTSQAGISASQVVPTTQFTPPPPTTPVYIDKVVLHYECDVVAPSKMSIGRIVKAYKEAHSIRRHYEMLREVYGVPSPQTGMKEMIGPVQPFTLMQHNL